MNAADERVSTFSMDNHGNRELWIEKTHWGEKKWAGDTALFSFVLALVGRIWYDVQCNICR